jgi:hypothetical protein
MANKDLFKQAIAEAKSVREAAIANAKEALEETLTPHLKDMLAAKLQEMDDSSTDEEVVNEAPKEDSKDEAIEEAPKKDDDTMEEAKDEDMDEAPKKEKHMDEAPKEDSKDKAMDEDLTEVEPVEAADDMEAEDDSEESEDEAEHDGEDEVEAIDGDEDISKLSVDQFKDMIRDIIAQEVGGDAEMGADMDAGDIEGMGDEEGAIDAEPDMDAMDAPEGEEEIDLDELLRELEATEVEEGQKEDDDKKMEEAEDKKDETVEEDVTGNSTANQESADHSAEGTNINKTVNEVSKEDKSDLKQAMETIETLKSELNEVNILNSKLLYVNKIFKANSLSESQKVNIIAAFDKAETVKEVKLVFETVSDNIVDVKKENVTEAKAKGMASKATGTTATKPEAIVLSEAAQRMQKLAGII